MPARDRRTIGELLAGSDALARGTLLDATPENARAMVRSWNQLVGPAVHLWAALASRPEAGRRLHNGPQAAACPASRKLPRGACGRGPICRRRSRGETSLDRG